MDDVQLVIERIVREGCDGKAPILIHAETVLILGAQMLVAIQKQDTLGQAAASFAKIADALRQQAESVQGIADELRQLANQRAA